MGVSSIRKAPRGKFLVVERRGWYKLQGCWTGERYGERCLVSVNNLTDVYRRVSCGSVQAFLPKDVCCHTNWLHRNRPILLLFLPFFLCFQNIQVKSEIDIFLLLSLHLLHFFKTQVSCTFRSYLHH
jgi:hypothetical protein